MQRTNCWFALLLVLLPACENGKVTERVSTSPPSPASSAVLPVAGVPNHTILVAQEYADRVAFVQTSTLSTVATVSTGPKPHTIAVDTQRRLAYVASYGDDTGQQAVTVVDLAARRAAGTMPVDRCRRPHGLAVDRLGKVWVGCENNATLVVVDPIVGREVRRESSGGARTHMVTAIRGGDVILASHLRSPYISIFDPSASGEQGRIPLPHGSEMIAESLDGTLWVTSPGHGTVIKLSPTAARSPGQRYRVAGKEVVGDSPVHLAVGPDGVVIHVAADGDLAVLSPVSGKVQRKLSFDVMGGDIVHLGRNTYAVTDSLQSRLLVVDLKLGKTLQQVRLQGGANHIALLPR